MGTHMASALAGNIQPQLGAAEIREHLNRLCKPPGSLGELEALAQRLCEIQRTLRPQTSPRRAVIFAADHGVTCEGVTAWPSQVTAAVVQQMQQRRTASGVFAQALSCEYEVVDIGMLRALESSHGESTLIEAARRRGTGNLRVEAAMTEEDFEYALAIGSARAQAARDAGCRLVIGGEMGIGNTTAASCLVGLLAEFDSDKIVGRGAGIDDAGLVRKRQVGDEAMERVRCLGSVGAKRIACEVGGLEIVALAGFYARAAEVDLVIVLDGFIATAAAILAEALRPGTSLNMLAGHCSSEPGHALALSKLDLQPLLHLNFRLGEATGALAALPLIDLAAAMVSQMATLDELVMS
jgi:nicotinate-nucleotide--dimethylbenzimidazole phosphoribosyltransferase